MRQVVLDTETTGLETDQEHRVIEIGGVEVIDRKITRNKYHQYVNPQREIDEGALQVHGITEDFLADKPLFKEIAGDFLEFVRGAELVIHNADFDIGFLDAELARLEPCPGRITDFCTVVDSLAVSRNRHPGQKNTLDALCKRYDVDASKRQLHGALLDAELLAEVYLRLTGGQVTLGIGGDDAGADGVWIPLERLPRFEGRQPGHVQRAGPDEVAAHEAFLDRLDKDHAEEGGSVWRREPVNG